MLEPVVSVVIPCFNTRDCAAFAIKSALAQHDVPVEVIVVDDGSTDGTLDMVRREFAGEERVRPFQMPRNGGPSAARNAGFRQARGEWIALLDSDDLWRENRLVRLLEHAKDADFIADNLMSFDAAAKAETGPVYSGLSDRFLTLSDFLLPSSPDRHDYGYLQPLIRTEFLRRHQIAYREDVRVGEDLLLNLGIMIDGGRAYYVDEPLYIYTTPVGAISRNASPYSRSSADTRPLIAALEEFRVEYGPRLADRERRALELRLSDLRANIPIGQFHRARAKGRLGEMIKLILTEPSIWRKAAERLLGRA
jgi:succinoglycan biosynthesis protein ExoO